MSQTALPKLVPLRYGTPYCTGCKSTLHPGWLVAYWPTKTGRGKTIYCAGCHHRQIELTEARQTPNADVKPHSHRTRKTTP